MKKITCQAARRAIFLLFAFCTANLSAQHSIQSAWSYTNGTDKPGSTLALAWYHADAALSGNVIRLSYTNTKEDVYYANTMHHLQLDISRRWNSPIVKKVNVFFEAGLSGMVTNTLVRDLDDMYYLYYYNYTDDRLASPDLLYYGIERKDYEVANYLYEVKKKTYLLEFLPGANVSFGFEVLLSESFFMGAHTGGHLYYHLGLDKTVSYLQNGLHAGIRF